MARGILVLSWVLVFCSVILSVFSAKYSLAMLALGGVIRSFFPRPSDSGCKIYIGPFGKSVIAVYYILAASSVGIWFDEFVSASAAVQVVILAAPLSVVIVKSELCVYRNVRCLH